MASAYSKYVVVFSNAQLTKEHPENKPYAFTNNLSETLRLNSGWEVALLDIQYFHKWYNFLRHVHCAVLKSTIRSEKQPRSLLKTDPTTQLIMPEKPFLRVTDEMLKAKGLTHRREGVILWIEGDRHRVFGYYLDFPELGREQLFMRSIPKNRFSHYSRCIVNRWGRNEVCDANRETMNEWLKESLAQEKLEIRLRIVRELIRYLPGPKMPVLYTQAIPHGPLIVRSRDEEAPVVDEISEWSERFNGSIDVQQLPPKKEKLKPEECVPQWFINHMTQTENYLNENDLHLHVVVKPFTLARGYYESISAFLDYFCREVSKLICTTDEKDCIGYEYDSHTEIVAFTVKQCYQPLRIVCDSDYLSEIFGIDPISKAISCKPTPDPPPPPSPPRTENEQEDIPLPEYEGEPFRGYGEVTIVPMDKPELDPEHDQGGPIPTTFRRRVPLDAPPPRKRKKIITGIQRIRLFDTHFEHNPTEHNASETSYLYQLPARGTRPARLDFVRSMIVYSDIGEHIDTGGILTQHLARFDVDDRPGKQVSYAPHQLCYVPVAKTYVDSVYIQLNDIYGRPIPFSEEHDCVVSVKLHFRNPNAPGT